MNNPLLYGLGFTVGFLAGVYWDALRELARRYRSDERD